MERSMVVVVLQEKVVHLVHLVKVEQTEVMVHLEAQAHLVLLV
jgi:hypothetical protein